MFITATNVTRRSDLYESPTSLFISSAALFLPSALSFLLPGQRDGEYASGMDAVLL